MSFDDQFGHPAGTMHETNQILREILAAINGQTGLLEEMANDLEDLVVLLTPTPSAVSAVITVQGGQDMGLTVDTTTGNAVLGFTDDHEDPTNPPAGDGSGLTVTFASDDAAVATPGTAVAGTDAAGNVNYEAPIAVSAEGSFNLSCVVANTSGAPLTDDDGVTEFVQPQTVNVPVSAGQAAQGNLSVTE